MNTVTLRRRRFGVFEFLALGAIWTAVSSAQEYRGRIQGVVTDATDAAVSGAIVRLQSVDTGIATVRQTDNYGRYIFDLVPPGAYKLAAEAAGFSRFEQDNIVMQNRGDVTVNMRLQLGAVAETVKVSDAPPAVQFNTSGMDLTIDNGLVSNLPVVARNPFTLALLDPAVTNQYTLERAPFKMWAPSQMEVGGSTSQKNDTLLDGMPAQVGPKASYAPPMDAVTEVTVQQNSVDAEYGHSAGGVLNVSMKSGTNDVHGVGYYFGRNPALNAAQNAITHAPNQVRNHIYGATIGHPIKKNKLFHFFAIERWNEHEPRSNVLSLPTDLEKQGNFSQSLNPNGGLRAIYDPFSTRLNAANGQVTRDPFPGNIIPTPRMDPTALKFIQQLWQPNGAGDDITRINNFKADYFRQNLYYNVSSRGDYIISEKWKIFGRFSRFRTDLTDQNYTHTDNIIYQDINSGFMNSLNISGEIIYTPNPSTVIDIRGNYISINDDFSGGTQNIDPSALSAFWKSAWYNPYVKDNPSLSRFFFPGFNVNGSQFGKPNWFYQHPENYFNAAKISKQMGRHYLKAGGESRHFRVFAANPAPFNFQFTKSMTAETYINPNTRLNGDGWATLLLGALDSNSVAQTTPFLTPTTQYWASFIQDDFKLSRRITLNLGLRWEYELPVWDRDQYRVSRPFDRNNPIPEMQATPPQIPKQAIDIMNRPYQFSGAWNFTDSSNPGMWNAKRLNLLPRVGVALRVNDRTAVRLGWARFIVPPNLQTDIIGTFPYPGFSASTTVAPALQGVPQAVISDPFPASNPLILPLGKSLGRYTNLGGDAVTDALEFRPAVNDRFNVSFQRDLFWKFVADITYFGNFGRSYPYTKRFNLSDPQLSYQYKTLLTTSVSNPFFNYLTPDKFPGQLRNQQQVSLGSLLKPFPQYGNVNQTNTPGAHERYDALQMRVQRQFSSGFNFLWTYNYNRERTEQFFNSDQEYAGVFSYQGATRPRHRMTISGVYELPFGHGRRLLSHVPAIAEAVVGGWTTTAIYSYNSGNQLLFGQLDVVGDPHIDNPSKWGYRFNPAAFRQSAAFTSRVNPWFYPGIVGPGYKNLDLTLAKFFPITERFRLEFKMEAYNVSNTFDAADPSLNVTSSTFGRVVSQQSGIIGRQFQYNLKLHF